MVLGHVRIEWELREAIILKHIAYASDFVAVTA
jgi:hypothetical protein